MSTRSEKTISEFVPPNYAPPTEQDLENRGLAVGGHTKLSAVRSAVHRHRLCLGSLVTILCVLFFSHGLINRGLSLCGNRMAVDSITKPLAEYQADTAANLGASRPGATTKDDDEQPLFLARVEIAVGLVRKEYPGAKLYEANAPEGREPVPDPQDFANLTVTFNAYKDGKQGTAQISSPGGAEFGRVVFTPKPWVEDIVIAWPPAPVGWISLQDAVQITQSHGYGGPFTSLTLRHPLSRDPKFNEPFYILGLGQHLYAFVGVKDGKFFTEQATG